MIADTNDEVSQYDLKFSLLKNKSTFLIKKNYCHQITNVYINMLVTIVVFLKGK